MSYLSSSMSGVGETIIGEGSGIYKELAGIFMRLLLFNGR